MSGASSEASFTSSQLAHVADSHACMHRMYAKCPRCHCDIMVSLETMLVTTVNNVSVDPESDAATLRCDSEVADVMDEDKDIEGETSCKDKIIEKGGPDNTR